MESSTGGQGRSVRTKNPQLSGESGYGRSRSLELDTMMRTSSCLLIVASLAHAGAPSWLQWQGPTHDNISPEKGLLASWPEKGPALLWHVDDLGEGYSTPTFDQGR